MNKLSKDQIEAASKVLGRAFQDDPLFIHCFSDPIEKKRKITIHCEYMILLGMVSGEVYITSSNIEGVAVWHPYGIKDQTIRNHSKDIIRRLRNARKEDFSDPLVLERISKFEEIANNFQKEHVNFPHWYLSIIGVDPKYQAMGYASKLLKRKLAEIDKQNLPCFLHTENGNNVQTYEHFGFKMIGKMKVPNTNFHFHGMLRKEMK
ncbi:MAG: GNAT family N-acetyltransferase [Candidatus Hodarchaeota archaeon]